jgi:hypothetical protein
MMIIIEPSNIARSLSVDNIIYKTSIQNKLKSLTNRMLPFAKKRFLRSTLTFAFPNNVEMPPYMHVFLVRIWPRSTEYKAISLLKFTYSMSSCLTGYEGVLISVSFQKRGQFFSITIVIIFHPTLFKIIKPTSFFTLLLPGVHTTAQSEPTIHDLNEPWATVHVLDTLLGIRSSPWRWVYQGWARTW